MKQPRSQAVVSGKWTLVINNSKAFTNFYKAEEYHQDYYNENPWEPYNLSVVRPKVKHFEDVFVGKMK